MSNLYIVATPIGNLKDLSQRAIETLERVDLVLCEDTRVTKKLLNHYGIKTPTLSYHQYSKLKKIGYILKLLEQGKNLALVSDAGTPGVSDPGNKLVEEIIKLLDGKVKIVPIPGASAITVAASISGLPMDKFLFLGFPPKKRKRKKFFKKIIDSEYPTIFYESPHRIIKTLNEINSLIKERKVIVGRELTKKFETIYRGTIEEVLEKLKKETIRGEFVVIVEPEV